MTRFTAALRSTLVAVALAATLIATGCGADSSSSTSSPAIDLRDPDAATTARADGSNGDGQPDETRDVDNDAVAGNDTASDTSGGDRSAQASAGPLDLPAPSDGAVIDAAIDDDGIVTVRYPDLDATVIEWAGTRFRFDDFTVEVQPPGFSGTRAIARATLTLDELIGQRFEFYDLDKPEVGSIITADGERHSRSNIDAFLEADLVGGVVDVSWPIYFASEVDAHKVLDGAIIDFGSGTSVPLTIAMNGVVDDSAVVEGLWAVNVDLAQQDLGLAIEEVQVATALWPAIDNEVVAYRQAPAGTRLIGIRGTVSQGPEASRFGENVQGQNLVMIVDGVALDRLDGQVAAPNIILDEERPSDAVQWVYEVPADASTLTIEFRSGDEVDRVDINPEILNDSSADVGLSAG